MATKYKEAGINALLVQIDVLEKENTELNAQLARCKNDLTLIVKTCMDSEWQTVGDCLLDIKAVIACLPATVNSKEDN